MASSPTPPPDLAWCVALPKIELHAHINGSIPAATLAALAHDAGRDEDASPFLLGARGNRSLTECFQLFDLIYEVTGTVEAARRVTTDVIRSFEADGVRYLELRTSQRVHKTTGRTKRAYVATVVEAVQACNADPDLDIVVRLILSVDRRNSVEEAMETVDLALEFLDSGVVVGVDWCGDPTKGTFTDHIEVLERAREAGLRTAFHISEIREPANAAAIIGFKPDRLGHGTFLEDDNKEALRAAPIPLECCMTSNLLCDTVATPAEHHFGPWLAEGYPVILCTDDKGVFDCELSGEYHLAATTFGLSKADLHALTLASVDYIFDEEAKAGLRERMTAFWEEEEEKKKGVVEAQ